MVRIDLPSATIQFEDAAATLRLLEHEQSARLAAEAEQMALSAVYCLSGAPDPELPYGGLLTRRLRISERTAYDLVREGKIRYTCAGKKNYRVSEMAVREFLGDTPT
ncbi:helix-turn-helix domain-containing protein [Hymenobacter convexus]|uniref:helix-turn-helix domain-containing protein n=1 Tax=Hymenobacter sp. CA1UV-4 TaxID=3063782 RepID=UPI0027131698|nr:helix-turn-helix domain-containing protein [Hymenobacter sp. CA1UV-4]MDO7850407.1 helix-turn-helix domain-containing protein [Hymenobacter sp. CA1UV-4]